MIYHFDDYTLDADNFTLSKQGKQVSLEPKVFDVLTYLIKNREKLFIKLDKYLDEPRDEELYAKALIEAEGDEVEAGHIYYGLFMQSISDDEA